MTDYKAQVYGLLGGTLPWSFAMHLTGPANYEATLAAQLDSAVGALWSTGTHGMAALTAADVSLEGSAAATLASDMTEVSKTNTARHVVGINANPSLPWDNAVVVGFTGPQVTRTDRGRIRLPAVSVDNVAAHVYTSTFTTTHLKVVLDAFFPAVRAGGLAYFSYNALKLVNGTMPFQHNSLTKYHISNKPGVVRKRTTKVVPTFVLGTL
jgi:hypothetical protein